jgi:hypothetical protein
MRHSGVIGRRVGSEPSRDFNKQPLVDAVMASSNPVIVGTPPIMPS